MSQSSKAGTSYDILNDMADKLESEYQRLKQIEEIVKKRPEWLEEDSRLKELIKSVA